MRPMAMLDEATVVQQRETYIDEVLDESFPSSDPPPWTSGVEPRRYEPGSIGNLGGASEQPPLLPRSRPTQQPSVAKG